MTPSPGQPYATSPHAGRNLAIVLGAVLFAGLATVVVILSLPEQQPEPDAAVEITGVETYEIVSYAHTDDPVTYAQTPPVGGDHAGTWQNCGFYESPVRTEQAVHALEHGAVWITYAPSVSRDQIEELRALAQEEYVLVSPWADTELPAPIVFSAWGVQQEFDELPDVAASTFLETYRQASSSPEPGAPCSGGDSEPR